MEKRKDRKLTIYDIAQELGLSIASVSRALNDKEGVSEETREYVIKKADEMGYRASQAASGLSRKGKRLIVLFPELVHDYDNEIKRGILKAQKDFEDYHLSIDIETIQNGHTAFLERIREVKQQGYHGILLIPPEGEAEFSGLLREKGSGGIPIATLTTDVDRSCRVFSVCVNGRVAGSTACELLCMRMKPGDKVAVVTGQMTSSIHRSTVNGFCEELKNWDVELAGVYEHHDHPGKAYVMAEQVMKEHPDLRGLYLGTANSVTFCNRLIQLGYKGKLQIVASDVFPRMMEYIRSGLVFATIFQNPYRQGYLAVKYMYEYLTGSRVFVKDEFLLEPQIVLRSNLQFYEDKLLDIMSEDVIL